MLNNQLERLASKQTLRVLLITVVIMAMPVCKEKAPAFTNQLVNESSPYLLRHAHNPVDWYPWGGEAFARAQKENKPVFLSIGYSTCHWCRVMEEESFENPEVAEVLNHTFIAVKVDREELPEVDAFYMKACRMMADACGWPLTLVLTPDRKPFYAGTYHPPHTSSAGLGLVELAKRAQEMWRNERGRAESLAADFMGVARQETGSFRKSGNALLNESFAGLRGLYNPVNGGFTDSPGFPNVPRLRFLLAYHYNNHDPLSLAMVEKTLTAVLQGAIHDHAGGGFHRYATDRGWNRPHFEKMLYDQALLATVLTEAFQITGKEQYASAAARTLEFVLREMTSPAGGFYSALDAAGAKGEGSYYLWSRDEIAGELEKPEQPVFYKYYSLHEFNDGKAGHGTNVIVKNGTAIAKTDTPVLQTALHKLYEYRLRRETLFKDDKILTDWNSLMISALAVAGNVLDRQDFIQAAEKASERLNSGGRLQHVAGKNESAAGLQDYAFFIQAQLDLYQATFNPAYLKNAVELNRVVIREFHDDRGGFFFTPASAGSGIPFRMKEFNDGETPAGNAVALMNQVRLARITGDQSYVKYISERVPEAADRAYTLLWALSSWYHPGFEIHITGGGDAKTMLRSLAGLYLPGSVILFSSGENSEILKYAPFTASQKMRNGRATAYICKNYRCNFPVNDVNQMLQLLQVDKKVIGN